MSDVPPEADLHDASIGALLTRALADAEGVARAEIALQKARLLALVDAARLGAIFLLGALLTGSMALTGLVVGLLLILARSLGPIWATVIVVGVLCTASGLLGWLALNRFKRMFAPAGGGAA